MSKVSDLLKAVTELRNAAQTLIGVADSLTDLFSGSGDVAGSAEQEITEKPPTLEAVRAVLADKSRSGFTAQVKALIEKYGADKLSEVDPTNYNALMADAEALSNE